MWKYCNVLKIHNLGLDADSHDLCPFSPGATEAGVNKYRRWRGPALSREFYAPRGRMSPLPETLGFPSAHGTPLPLQKS